jgi:hypothetical protein
MPIIFAKAESAPRSQPHFPVQPLVDAVLAAAAK